MGKCKLCGKDIGWFQRTHKECKAKKLQGSEDLINYTISFIQLTAFEGPDRKKQDLSTYFINESEASAIVLEGIGITIYDMLNNSKFMSVSNVYNRSIFLVDIFNITS